MANGLATALAPFFLLGCHNTGACMRACVRVCIACVVCACTCACVCARARVLVCARAATAFMFDCNTHAVIIASCM